MSKRLNSGRLLVFLVSIVFSCNAEGQREFSTTTRLQRVQQVDTESGPYPAAGHQPAKQFGLPTFEEQQSSLQQPSAGYLAPVIQLQPAFPSHQRSQEQHRSRRLQKKRGRLIQRQNLRTLPQQALLIIAPQSEQQLTRSRLRQSPSLVYQAPISRRPLNEAGAGAGVNSFNENDEIETFSSRLRQSSRLTGGRKETAEELDNDDDEEDDDGGSVESTTESRNREHLPPVLPDVPKLHPVLPAVPQLPPPAVAPPNSIGRTFVTFYPQTATGFVRPATYVQPAITSNYFSKFQLHPVLFSPQAAQPLLAQPQIRPVAGFAPTTTQYQGW